MRRKTVRSRMLASHYAVQALEARVLMANSPLSAVPALHSDPGAPASLYINFVGAPAMTWGGYSATATPAYDVDGDPSTFSTQELTNIQNIWARVAEKFSPFNIDVTTVQPADMSHGHTWEQIVGGTGAWSGSVQGGMAYVQGFSSIFEPSIGFSFATNLNNGDVLDTAEDIAHESGHGFNLGHQAVWNGNTLVTSYNTGDSLVAPIMGISFYAQRGLWYYGPTPNGPTSYQDDMAVIASSLNGFGYRPLTASQTPAGASTLAITNNTLSTSGIIESASQHDYYAFTVASASTASFTLSVAANGPMLHAILELHDANNNLIAIGNNASTLGQSLTTSLTPGNYYLVAKSYGQYGDIGQYSLGGSVTPTGGSSTPTFTLSGASSVSEGSTYTLGLSASDPGQTVSSWLVNWGDGSAAQTVNGNPSSVTHVYAVGPHSWTISASATDGTGTYAAGNSVGVNVQHIAPTPGISGTTSVDEGETFTLSLTASDPNHSILSWAINWGDGSAVQTVSGSTTTVNHVFAMGPVTRTINASMTDDVGTYAASSRGVFIQHIAPVPTISGASTTNEGATYTLSLAVSDPNHSLLSWTINWGDGSANQTVSGNTTSLNHVYASGPASYTIAANMTDDVGTYAASGRTVSVLHGVGPSASISGASSVAISDLYTLNLSATDPGHTIQGWSINWGDGSAVQSVNGNASSATHAYASPSAFTISASMQDDVGSHPANSQAVTVTSTPPPNTPAPDTTAPTASAVLDAITTPGQSSYTFTVTYTDAVAVQTATLNSQNILVTGPNGYAQAATLIALSSGDSPVVVATYSIPAPVGTWSLTHNGTYTVALQAGVSDTSGNLTGAGSLGSFTVGIAPPAISYGNLAAKGQKSKSGRFVAGGVAYYSFNLTQTEIVTIHFNAAAVGMSLNLFDSSMVSLSNRAVNKAATVTITLSPGTYYVQLGGPAKAVRYSLGLTTKPLQVGKPARKLRLLK